MGIWYVKKTDDRVNFIKKCFKVLTIKQVQNRVIVELPIENYETIGERLQEKLANKLSKSMYDKPNQNLVLASNLELETFKNTLYANNCNILNGRWLFKFLISQVVDYIAEKQGEETGKLNVAIMINDNSENNLKTIVKLAQKVKLLSIITSDIDRFKRVEEYLFENMGIVIHTTNNRRKALLKSSIIINVDFPEETVNQYTIPKKAIVINVSEKISIKSKRFEGVNINYYNVLLPENEKKWMVENNLINGFDENLLLESILYSKKSYDAIETQLHDVKIQYLIGNNGIICEKEFSVVPMDRYCNSIT